MVIKIKKKTRRRHDRATGKAERSIINPPRRRTGLKAASRLKNKPQSEIDSGLYSLRAARQLTQNASPGCQIPSHPPGIMSRFRRRARCWRGAVTGGSKRRRVSAVNAVWLAGINLWGCRHWTWSRFTPCCVNVGCFMYSGPRLLNKKIEQSLCFCSSNKKATGENIPVHKILTI